MPTFLIIGAHKSGTTALYHYLKQHPEIFMSSVKEPRFFALAGDSLDYRGPRDPAARCDYTDLEGYCSLFEGVENERAIGEASTLYLYHPDAPKRIKKYLPEVKLVAILRNPIDRAYSNYTYARMQGREPITNFREAIEAEEARIHDRWGPLWHYTRKGFYSEQLARYFRAFPRENLNIYLYDDLRSDLDGLRAIKKLIPEKLRAYWKNRLLNTVTVSPPPLSEVDRNWLELLYANEFQVLSELIERDLTTWSRSKT